MPEQEQSGQGAATRKQVTRAVLLVRGCIQISLTLCKWKFENYSVVSITHSSISPVPGVRALA